MAQNEVKYKVVVVGGSAGSLDIILKIIGDADATSGILYIIIIHRKNDTDSVLTGFVFITHKT